jgi:hypothetical protein
MQTFVIRYTNDKSDIAADVVAVRVASTDYFGMDYGEVWMFFHKVSPPVSYDDIVLAARKSEVKAIRHQY